MNLLIDRPPTTVMIGGAEYEINSDFRASILFELMIQDEEMNPYEKIEAALSIYFPVYPEGADLSEVFEALLWFYQCGRTDKKNRKTTGVEQGEQRIKPVYSYDYDDEYIYAAFRQQYGINLTEVEGLHWWEFRAMFKALDHDCEFVKIMGYRTTEITGDMSKAEKNFLNRMKSLHALPMSKAEQQETEALLSILQNGGDVDGLLHRTKDGDRDALEE